ncbi:putative 25 kd subunit of DNA-directed RNA polymerases I, II and III [Clavulina sp. PMI_390]|nr:putative 25 kd subunit of DNA-directed RNA polymerases I, II and III [Clavulina sp. PMI_390]
MAEDGREVARLWKINRTLLEMARDRGYEISQDELTRSLDDFRDAYAPTGSVDKLKMNFHVEKPSGDGESVGRGDRLYVYFALEKNVSIKEMRKFLEILEREKIQNGIIVYSEKMTPSAKKIITSLGTDFSLEDFEEAMLLVNITQHVLVPQHDVLTPEEKKALLAKYRLRETQLPRIQVSDPVARYYGLRRGQVVKITRPSETSGRYASYRIAF